MASLLLLPPLAALTPGPQGEYREREGEEGAAKVLLGWCTHNPAGAVETQRMPSNATSYFHGALL